jgi:signal transduction histidine kinase
MVDQLLDCFSFTLTFDQGECIEVSPQLLKILNQNSIAAAYELLPVDVTSSPGTQIKSAGSSGLNFHVIFNHETPERRLVALTLDAQSIPLARESGFIKDDLSLMDPVRSYWEEIERIESELELRGTELMHSERMASLGTLAAGVAHEINNPLAFIKSNLMSLEGFLQPMVGTVRSLLVLEEKVPELIADLTTKGLEYEAEELGFIVEDLDEILQDLRDGSERIVTIVSGLRQFSHPSESALVGTDLNDAVRVAIELSRNEFKYHATLDTDLNPLPTVEANSPKITQVLVNLIVNAAQAIEESGMIRVGSRVKDDNVEVWVEDNGGGIHPEHLSKIFNPFYTTKEVGKGTGLGLAISHRIMAEHGGSIDVESKLGEGTRFTLKFPVHT